MKRLTKGKRAVLGAAMAAIMLSGCAAQTDYFPRFDSAEIDSFEDGNQVKIEAGDAQLDAMTEVADNGTFRLLYSPKTAEIAVVNRDGSQVWRSNPEGRFDAGQEKTASGQLLLSTSDERDVTKEWDSSKDCTNYGQVIFDPLEDGLRVTYYFGQKQKVYLAPQAIPADRFEQDVLPKVESTSDSAFLRRVYGRISLKEVESIQTRDSLLERFPKLEEIDIYVLKNTPSKLELQKTETILSGIGYTMEDLETDQAACGYMEDSSGDQHIKVALEYRLNADGFTVRVPVSEIETTEGLKVTEIEVLRYFGSPENRQDGYAVLPHNSGAVLDFSQTVSPGVPVYNERVYGVDYGKLVQDRSSESPSLFLPAFGIASPDAPFVAVIEQNAAIASIRADGPRVDGSLPYVSTRYLLLDSALLSLDASPENRVPVYPKEAVRDDIVLRYFLLEPDAGYSEMANTLRDYYRNEQGWTALDSTEVPFVVETIGAIDVNRPIAGIPRQVTEVLTSFDQSLEIAEWFGEAVGQTPDLVLSGWRKGGLRSRMADRYDPESKLGGKSGLQALNEACAAAGSSLYLAADFPYVYRDSWFDGFSVNGDSSKFLTSESAFKPDYRASTYYMDADGLSAYMLRPDKMLKNAEAMSGQMVKAGMTGVAFPNLGRDIYTDYTNGAIVSRGEMEQTVRNLAEGLTQKELNIASDGLNAYLAGSTGLCYNLPLAAPNHPLLTKEIPWIQMVYSGTVSYTGPAANYVQDLDTLRLKSIETGSGLYAKLFAVSNETVKDTDFDFLFSSGFQENRDSLAQAARDIQQALAPVAGLAITEHSTEGDISRTTYEDGTRIYVNYGSTAAHRDGMEIPARGWYVADLKGGE